MLQKPSNGFVTVNNSKQHLWFEITPIRGLKQSLDWALSLNSGDDLWDVFYPDQLQTISGYRFIILSTYSHPQTIQEFLNTYISMLDKNSFLATRVILVGNQFEDLNQLPIIGYDGQAKVIGYNNKPFKLYPDLKSLDADIKADHNHSVYLLF